MTTTPTTLGRPIRQAQGTHPEAEEWRELTAADLEEDGE